MTADNIETTRGVQRHGATSLNASGSSQSTRNERKSKDRSCTIINLFDMARCNSVPRGLQQIQFCAPHTSHRYFLIRETSRSPDRIRSEFEYYGHQVQHAIPAQNCEMGGIGRWSLSVRLSSLIRWLSWHGRGPPHYLSVSVELLWTSGSVVVRLRWHHGPCEKIYSLL